MDVASRGGRTHALPYLFIARAHLATRSGRLADAVDSAARAAEVSRQIGSAETLAMARAVLLLPTLWRHGLHVSRKTVEAHLSRVFSKLDVHTRAALARRPASEP